MRDGGQFTRDTIEAALSSHQSAKLIREWQRAPHSFSGILHYPVFIVTLADGKHLELATMWEAHAFVAGLASARHAYEHQFALRKS